MMPMSRQADYFHNIGLPHNVIYKQKFESRGNGEKVPARSY